MHQMNEVVNSEVENGEQLMAEKALELETVPDLEESESFRDIEIMRSKIDGLELKLKEVKVHVLQLVFLNMGK